MLKKLKKPAAVLSAVTLMFSSLFRMTASGEITVTTYLHGDMNRNGRIDIADLVMHKSYILSEEKDTDLLTEKLADFDGYGISDAEDTIHMRDYLSGRFDDDNNFSLKNFTVTDSPLIPSSLNGTISCAQTTGEVRSLNFIVEFNNAKFNDSKKMSEEELENELFGAGTAKFPYESVTGYIERASYGNLTMSGDVFYCRLNANIEDYSTDAASREKLMQDILKTMDEKIDYTDYDGDGDGDIDMLTFTPPLENVSASVKKFWYAATHTWYNNQYFSVDGVKVVKYAGMDVMPYKENMYTFKRDYTHEFGHCMGLQDYYKYESEDSAGLKGTAGYCKMDDSLGDYCTFSKLMAGWLHEHEIEIYDTESGEQQTFRLSDPAEKGSCLILPVGKWDGNFNSEYFLIEYQSCEGNNYDVRNYLNGWYSDKNNTGLRVLHVQAEIYKDFWGRKVFKYYNYSDYYKGDDKQRILRLVNDPDHGFIKPGEILTGLKAYDRNGYETIDTGYTVKFEEKHINRSIVVSVTKK